MEELSEGMFTQAAYFYRFIFLSLRDMQIRFESYKAPFLFMYIRLQQMGCNSKSQGDESSIGKKTTVPCCKRAGQGTYHGKNKIMCDTISDIGKKR